MTQNPFMGFSDPELCQRLLARLENALQRSQKTEFRFMEVCGTHTVAIFRSGLRSLLPHGITHLSGPGCPVCVTHDAEIAAFLTLAQNDSVIVATFGDLLRVPGPQGYSLKHAKADGAHIEIVYSPLDALSLAEQHPTKTIVFLGVGFETTAPTVAATVMLAQQRKLDNFCIFSLHKLVPPALRALLAPSSDSHETYNAAHIDGFLLPGHVSTIVGMEPYTFLAQEYRIPAVIGGFEPADILLALCLMLEQHNDDNPHIVNAYPRAVGDHGNPRAQTLLDEYFMPSDALWRGIGSIPSSGLSLRPAFAHFDAMARFDLTLPNVPPLPGCQCGNILKGLMPPTQCPLFAKRCTPQNPIGPCMVSTEGSCAAYYAYGNV